MSDSPMEQAHAVLEHVEAHLQTLTPKTEAHHTAERIRDNLAACIAMGECNPKAGEILLPNVLAAAQNYLAALGGK